MPGMSESKKIATFGRKCPEGLRWLGQLNSNTNTSHISTHPSTYSHFTPKARWKNRKAPASPPHHKGGRSRSGRAPCMSEPKGGAGEMKKGWGWFSLFLLHNLYILTAMAALHHQQLNLHSSPPPPGQTNPHQ